MHAHATSRPVAGIDVERVTCWFVEHAADVAPPLSFALIHGGLSNLTYRVVDAAGRAYVLRRPPLHSVLPSAHDMAREYRIIDALGPTAVPVPPAVGLCEDPSVTGAPFYVMAFVEGAVLYDAERAAAFDASLRRDAAESLVDTLVALHAVDPDAVGLGSLGRKQDYIARQLRTWRRQWEHSRTRDLRAVEEAHGRLAARIPAQGRAAVVHGDYRLDNVIFDEAAQVATVMDWELCTLGDPLADLGLLLVYWTDPDDAFTSLPNSPSSVDGFPRKRELAQRYARRSGRDLAELDFYVAFGYWKLAVILEGVYARFKAGAYGPPREGIAAYADRVECLAEAALAAAERAGR